MTKTRSMPAASPEDLLKAAVAGKAEPKSEPAAPMAGVSRFRAVAGRLRGEGRLLGVAAAALALGATLGAGLTAVSSPRRTPVDPVAGLSATVDAGRIETARLGDEVAKLSQALADMRGAGEGARKEAAARGTALSERIAQGERAVGGKVAALGERFEQVEREQSARIAALSAQLDRRPGAPVTAAKAEPAQTGSLAEAKAVEPRAGDAKPVEARVADPKPKPAAERPVAEKPVAEKPPVLDGWALRDVYDGAAILENRRRRIVEVGPGDTLPGVGRVEAVERRGHDWVVVTRQGLVTAQPW